MQHYVYPCPCGYFFDPIKECTCSNQVITLYQKRIYGPMLDRIDIHIEAPRVDYEKLSDGSAGGTLRAGGGACGSRVGTAAGAI
ncbi:MAG TPA: hypothetical protein DEH22_14685 [Chloroflexi bacterium]|nr:hypothetical protein [Chloroflexota bacterium]